MSCCGGGGSVSYLANSGVVYMWPVEPIKMVEGAAHLDGTSCLGVYPKKETETQIGPIRWWLLRNAWMPLNDYYYGY